MSDFENFLWVSAEVLLFQVNVEVNCVLFWNLEF